MSSDEPSVPPSPQSEQPEKEESGFGRRKFLRRVGGGFVTAAVGAPAALAVRSLVPNALYEKPLRFKAGAVESFAEGPTFIPDQRVFVFRQAATFHCISAVCTHLGCTVQLVRGTGAGSGTGGQAGGIEFACPCHGSKYTGDGSPYAGPAPRPLSYFRLAIAPDDGQLVVDLSQETDKGWRLTV
jgi:menaquinol-cytochrome c reductase iron-sulfur subunit